MSKNHELADLKNLLTQLVRTTGGTVPKRLAAKGGSSIERQQQLAAMDAAMGLTAERSTVRLDGATQRFSELAR